MSEYDIKIVRRQFDQTSDDWHATVTRLSDGKQLLFIRAWLRLLKWQTRRAALDRAFRRADAYERDGQRTKEYRR